MGDRIVYYIEGASCAAYGHWIGEKGIDLLKGALPTMRKDDDSYAMARLIAYLCKETESSVPTGVGVLRPPKDSDKADAYGEYSHGDAGVVIINAELTRAECFAGYLKDEHPNGIELSGGVAE